MNLKKDYASEAGHWYTMAGEPMYEVPSSKGTPRPTTLRDARKMNLVPSVTTILKVAANEGLNRWIKTNLLMAAATLPRVEGESSDDWIKRVEDDARKQSQEAAELGTRIHGSMEKFYSGSYAQEHMVYCVAANNALLQAFGSKQEWIPEKSFSHSLGYGGKIDLHSNRAVIDFKTSAFDESKKDFGYQEHLMQLAAYGVAVCQPGFRAANVYISTSVPGLVVVKEWTTQEILKGWDMFRRLLEFWQIKNDYKPEQA